MSDLKVEEVSLEYLDGYSNFLQSGYWGRLRNSTGWKSIALKVNWKGENYPLLVLVRIFKGLIPIAYVPHGPAVDVDGEDREYFIHKLSKDLVEFLPLGTIFVRYDFLWGEIGKDNLPEYFDFKGFTKAPLDIQPPDTVIIPLDASEEDLLAAMHKKTRYNIRLADKKEVVVKKGSLEELEKWYEMYRITAERDKISIHSYSYYEKVFSSANGLNKNPQSHLYLAYHDEDLLAGIIVLTDEKRATYLYGASTNEKRNLMPAYALQWRAMRDAKESGCTSYDMFGIPPADDPDHPMHGLYRFKTGFGGEIHHRLGAWDYRYSSLVYPLYYLLEKTRKFYYKTLKKR